MVEVSRESGAEFADCQLGNVQRNRRAAQVVDSLVLHGGRSVAQTCKGWAAAKGCYRLVNQEGVTHAAMLLGHRKATALRASGRAVVLAPQDSTTLSYGQRDRIEGLGPVDSSLSVQGFFAHTTLLVDPAQDEVLGVAAQQVWARSWTPVSKTETDAERKRRPRESQHWSVGQEDVARAFGREQVSDGQWTPPPPDAPHVIALFDREGDAYEAVESCMSLGHGFVIRAVRDRKLKEAVWDEIHSFAAVESAPELGRVLFEVPRRGKEPARSTVLTIRAATMTLLPPKNRGRKGQPLTIGMVLVKEAESPPPGTEPLCWYLLTSEPCETMEEALRGVEYYRFRWRVEEFHMGLKTGCGVERAQFETMHALENYLALASVASWRLLALRDAARSGKPDVPPEVLSNEEKLILREQFPRLPPKPTAREWLIAVAKLGGFFGRKSDGDPGWRTLWWGWQRLMLLSEGWKLARQKSGYR